ncbi:hypothetical protein BC830DRAFT_915756 [Chytriomyces sp. MP71]|nr:hypothetical protein BC830DRAFT_915756 [Chytriomyces sp. MP71]
MPSPRDERLRAPALVFSHDLARVDDALLFGLPPLALLDAAPVQPDTEPAPQPGRRVLPCHECRLNRKKCDAVRPACGRCTTKYLDCVYEAGQRNGYTKSVARNLLRNHTLSQRNTKRGIPCYECRNVRKRCDKLKPSCTTCIERGTPCIYQTAASTCSSTHSSSSNSGSPLLDQPEPDLITRSMSNTSLSSLSSQSTRNSSSSSLSTLVYAQYENMAPFLDSYETIDHPDLDLLLIGITDRAQLFL